jgi:peptidoglycan/LPS O-acetylase OafA/YrhL
MSNTETGKERFHFLDGLRGIAACFIVFHHAFTGFIIQFCAAHHVPFPDYYFKYFTQSGVDLFFVLSGVVLLRPYMRGQRPFHTIDYFIRRARRIYPPYFFALLFGAAVVWFNNAYPTWYNAHGMHIQFSWAETLREALIVNFSGTFYNLAWWSLGVEVVFYIIAPLALYVFPRRERLSDGVVALMIAAMLCVATGLLFFMTDHLSWIYSLTYNVSDTGRFMEYPLCFMMGMFLAARDFDARHGWLFFGCGLVLLACSWYHVSFMTDHFYPLLHSGYALIYAGIIIFAFNYRTLRRFLDRPGMIWLGERSYSLFLIHFSVFYLVDNLVSHFTGERGASYGILTRVVGIPLALLAAMLLFWWVERRQARGLVTAKAFWPWQVDETRSEL